METATTDDWTTAPYAEWLEDVIRDMVAANPVCIAMEMICEDGSVNTCYYNVDMSDRDVMIGAMRDDNRMRWLKEHREEIREVLSDDYVDEEDDEIDGDGVDEPCGTD